MSELTSASVPPIGGESRTGEGRIEVIVYATSDVRTRGGEGWAASGAAPRLCFRHFPNGISAQHPRAPALHAAAVGSGRCPGRLMGDGGFVYADSRTGVDEPPSGGSAAEASGLDLVRFKRRPRRGGPHEGGAGFVQRDPRRRRRDPDRVPRTGTAVGRRRRGDGPRHRQALHEVDGRGV